MEKNKRIILGLVVGGLTLAGGALAATNPSLTPIAALREPKVVVKNVVGTVKSIDAASITVYVPATKKVAAADYTFSINSDTRYYYRDSIVGSNSDVSIGDTVKVWSLKLENGTAIKIWDRKIWVGTKIGRVADLVKPVTGGAGQILEDESLYGSFTLKYNSKISYAAVGKTNTVIVTEKNNTASTWGSISNNTRVKVTGLWNDVQKILTISKIVILTKQ